MLQVNEYFDGNVKSIAFQSNTLPATVGVMAPGNYVFNTNAKEEVSIVSGALNIRMKHEDKFTTYSSGQSFKVSENTSFDVKVNNETAYLCLYG